MMDYDFRSPNEKKRSAAIDEKVAARQKNLEAAAKSKSEPGIWDRLAQYPEDIAVMIGDNAADGSMFVMPNNSPSNEKLNQAYEKALQKAVSTGKVPSGWSGL